MDERQSTFIEQVPQSARRIVERSFNSVGGRANAIQAMCLCCTSFNRDEVRNCPVILCPLNPWRPFQRNTLGPEAVSAELTPPPDWDVELDGPWVPDDNMDDTSDDDEI